MTRAAFAARERAYHDATPAERERLLDLASLRLDDYRPIKWRALTVHGWLERTAA